MKWLKTAVYSGFVVLSACGAPGKAARVTALSAVQNVGCKAAQSEMWNSLYGIAEEGAAFPSARVLRAELVQAGNESGLSGDAFARYVDAFVSNYSITIEGIQAKFDPQDSGAWKKALAEMEIGIRVTDLHAELNDQITASLNKLDAAEAALGTTCKNPGGPPPPPPPPPGGSVWDQLQKTVTPEIYGARKVLAVAYQSCDVLALPPMTAATPNVQGITSIGVRSDGGQIREISSVSQLNATDYYYHGQTLAASTCFDVHSDPLIYNFGGKPFTTVKDETKLDLFTRVTTGGPSLGIDCSGFVASALALGGLKTDPKNVLKADLIGGIPSVAFMEPQNNHLSCLQKIAVDARTSILPGDIAAINGNVIMIDSIGDDPLAIGKISSLAGCTSANINPSNFNFNITQSAPVKSGIGINRIKGADYMPESATIRNGFIAYAVAACRAKFGGDATVSSPNLSLVRHLKTPECLAPRPLVMSHEDCVASCKALK
jgi:hypothetical protein